MSNKVDPQKPGCEWKLGGGKYSPLDQGSLKMTLVALVHFAITDFAISGMAALRAMIALRPTHFEQSLSTLFFGAVLGEESRQT